MANWFEEQEENLRNTVQNPGQAIRSLGNRSRGTFGSAGYLIPGLGTAQLGADFENINANKDAAQNDENVARDRTNESIGQLDSLRQNQLNFSSGLKKNAIRDEEGLLGQAASGERRNMAESIRKSKSNAASRGLLGSGFQKQSEAESTSKAAANTASKQNQIHRMTQEQIQDADNLAVQLGLEMGGIQQSQSDKYYQMAIQNMNQRSSAIGSLLNVGGMGVGLGLGRMNQGNDESLSGEVDYQGRTA